MDEQRHQDAQSAARQPTPQSPPVVVPVDNPLSSLPETAVRLLEAAQRILIERGFHALTLSTVAAESGENKAMTAYYFGNKAGLVAALVDAVIHDEFLDAASHMREVPAEQQLEQLVLEMQRMSETTEDFLGYFDLLPHVLRNPQLRQRLATLYDWYIELKLDWMGIDRDDEERRRGLRPLGQVMSAIIDGLALQALIDPDRFPTEPAYRVVERLLDGCLPAQAARATVLEDARDH